MKRIQMPSLGDGLSLRQVRLTDNLPEELTDCISRLKLLYDVPFSYLISQESHLPPESVRFFYIDENWVNALAKGVLSVGVTHKTEALTVQMMFPNEAARAKARLREVRYRKMHGNHKSGIRKVPDNAGVQSGFIMRSVLTRRMKGLDVAGSNGTAPLEILRMEALSEEVFICVFDGEVTNVVLSEPKVGLRFGCPDSAGKIDIRHISDDENFGKNTGKKADVNAFTNANGVLKVAELAKELGRCLNTDGIGSAQVAFELIATARRAEFIRK